MSYISGIPCSGKTTYCHDLNNGKVSFNNVYFSNVLYLVFDEIMVNTKLPYGIFQESTGRSKYEL